jgi:hypothetical protein
MAGWVSIWIAASWFSPSVARYAVVVYYNVSNTQQGWLKSKNKFIGVAWTAGGTFLVDLFDSTLPLNRLFGIFPGAKVLNGYHRCSTVNVLVFELCFVTFERAAMSDISLSSLVVEEFSASSVRFGYPKLGDLLLCRLHRCTVLL